MSNDMRGGRKVSDTHENKMDEAQDGANLSRRRFTKAGLIAVPAVMTLTSRPVLGNQCSLSGMLSTTYSGPVNETVCGGRTPGFWKTHPDYWPDYNVEPGKIICVETKNNGKVIVTWNEGLATTLFSQVFTGDTLFTGETLMNVMWKSGDEDRYQLGSHAAAAWFNAARSEYDYGMNPQDVIDKYHAAIAGTYTNAYSINYPDPLEALKEEFRVLNEREQDINDADYSFVYVSAYWIDQETFDAWNDGTLVCPN